MLSRWSRTWSPRLLQPVTHFLSRMGVTPNALTLAGLAMAALAGGLVAAGKLLPGAAALLFSGVLDSLDGELARQSAQPSHLGPFIDSVADHYGDFAIYLGLAYRALVSGEMLAVLLVITAMFGSLIGSHIRSRAGMVGIDLKNTGIFTRMERNIVLLLALLTGWIIPALALLALGNNLSALQRIAQTLKYKEEPRR